MASVKDHVARAVRRVRKNDYPEPSRPLTVEGHLPDDIVAAEDFMVNTYVPLCKECGCRQVSGYNWWEQLSEILHATVSSKSTVVSTESRLRQFKNTIDGESKEGMQAIHASFLTPERSHTDIPVLQVAPNTWVSRGLVYHHFPEQHLESFRRAKASLEVVLSSGLPCLCVPPLGLGVFQGHHFATLPIIPLQPGSEEVIGRAGVATSDTAVESVLLMLAHVLRVDPRDLPRCLRCHMGGDGQLWVVEASGIVPFIRERRGEPVADTPLDPPVSPSIDSLPPDCVALPVFPILPVRPALFHHLPEAVTPSAFRGAWCPKVAPREPCLSDHLKHLSPPPRPGLQALLRVVDAAYGSTPAAPHYKGLQFLRVPLAGANRMGMATLPCPVGSGPAPRTVPPVHCPADIPRQTSLIADAMYKQLELAALDLIEGRVDKAADALHRRDIPVRFLGGLWDLVQDLPVDDSSSSGIEKMRRAVATEMVARALKNLLNAGLNKANTSEDAIRSVDAFLERLMKQKKDRPFGSLLEDMKPFLSQKFGIQNPSFRPKDIDKVKVYLYLCSCCGLKVTQGKCIGVIPAFTPFNFPRGYTVSLPEFSSALSSAPSHAAVFPLAVDLVRSTLLAEDPPAERVEAACRLLEQCAQESQKRKVTYAEICYLGLVANLRWSLGLRDEAAAAAEEIVSIHATRFGVSAGQDKAAKPLASFNHAVAITSLVEITHHRCIDPVSGFLTEATPEAVELVRKAYESLVASGVDPMCCILPFAFCLSAMGQVDEDTEPDEPSKFLTELLELWTQRYGYPDVQVAPCFEYLARLRSRQGASEEAARCFCHGINLLRLSEGDASPSVSSALNNFAMFHFTSGDPDGCKQALSLFKRSLETTLVHSPQSSEVAILYNNIASVHYKQREWDLAEKLFLKSQELYLQQETQDEENIQTCTRHIKLCRAKRRIAASIKIQKMFRRRLVRVRELRIVYTKLSLPTSAVLAVAAAAVELGRDEAISTALHVVVLCGVAGGCIAAVGNLCRNEQSLLVAEESAGRDSIGIEEAAAWSEVHKEEVGTRNVHNTETDTWKATVDSTHVASLVVVSAMVVQSVKDKDDIKHITNDEAAARNSVVSEEEVDWGRLVTSARTTWQVLGCAAAGVAAVAGVVAHCTVAQDVQAQQLSCFLNQQTSSRKAVEDDEAEARQGIVSRAGCLAAQLSSLSAACGGAIALMTGCAVQATHWGLLVEVLQEGELSARGRNTADETEARRALEANAVGDKEAVLRREVVVAEEAARRSLQNTGNYSSRYALSQTVASYAVAAARFSGVRFVLEKAVLEGAWHIGTDCMVSLEGIERRQRVEMLCWKLLETMRREESAEWFEMVGMKEVMQLSVAIKAEESVAWEDLMKQWREESQAAWAEWEKRWSKAQKLHDLPQQKHPMQYRVDAYVRTETSNEEDELERRLGALEKRLSKPKSPRGAEPSGARRADSEMAEFMKPVQASLAGVLGAVAVATAAVYEYLQAHSYTWRRPERRVYTGVPDWCVNLLPFHPAPNSRTSSVPGNSDTGLTPRPPSRPSTADRNMWSSPRN
eukprot:Sspe_Gene.32578::Locus_15958_Transcript_1_1_Confidence_1.000_Length_4784::g.32578::m.32578